MLEPTVVLMSPINVYLYVTLFNFKCIQGNKREILHFSQPHKIYSSVKEKHLVIENDTKT